MFYAFLFIWVFVCLLLWVAGSPSITSANEEIGEGDDSGIEHTNPSA